LGAVGIGLSVNRNRNNNKNSSPLLGSRRQQIENERLVMKMKTVHKAGFTLVEIMIVVAIIGLLAAIAVPNFVKARTTAQMNACINNLRQIDGAIQQWALEQKKDTTATVTYADISDYLKNAVTCPSGGTTFDDSYTITTVNVVPICKKVPATHKLPP
jgi:prepilin-type N-terminal cleavage/methylation domain-containing protein